MINKNNIYQKFREKYNPKNEGRKIKCLFIAESPPKSEDDNNPRFFYNPNQEKGDFLFKSIMEIIFPDFKDNYQKGEMLKEKYLQRFKELGFYLIDAVDTPINVIKDKRKRNNCIKKNIENKIREIEELITKDTPIIIIKKNVFEIFYPELMKKSFNVVHSEYIPFPSSGQQRKFKQKFKQYFARISD